MLDVIAQTNCKLDGKVVPCDEINQPLGLPMQILFGVLLLLVIAAIGFSVLMFLHALKSDNPDRKLWMIIIAVSFGIGGIVYYFLIKKVEKEVSQPVKFEAKPQDGTEAAEVPTSPLDVVQSVGSTEHESSSAAKEEKHSDN